jgi:hypothetical protein
MRILKITLSLLALLVGAIATAMTAGLFNVPPTIIGIATAGGILLGYLGIAPFPISAATSRVVSGIALFLGAVVAWHTSVVTAAINPHPWLWHIVGVVAILAGVIGKSPLPHAPPAPAAP